MTEKSREYWQQWLTPGVIINFVAVLILIGGAWVRLSSLEAQVTKMQGQIEALQVANQATQTTNQAATQSAAIELVRYQERVATQAARISVLEDFKNTQEQVNVRVFSTLSKLGG